MYTKQILIVSTFMELNGFIIGPEINKLFKIKVVTVTARRPVGKLPGTPRSPLPRQNHQGRCRTTVAPRTDIALTQYGIEQKLCSPTVTFFGLHT